MLPKRLFNLWHQGSIIGRVVRRSGKHRIVSGVFPDIDGGIILDAAVDGFRCWNLADVEVLPKRATGAKAGTA